MEFCPKCGTVLVPSTVGHSKLLTCPRCGYKSKVKKPAGYRISEKGREAKEIAVVEKEKKPKKPAEREYEIEPPEYYEEFYEGE
jgi:DNA-directed RNA polymerase subunit M